MDIAKYVKRRPQSHHEARDYLPSNYRGFSPGSGMSVRPGQGKMAESVGVGQSTWSRLENGASALTVEQLAAAAAVLGARPSASLRWLIGQRLTCGNEGSWFSQNGNPS